MGIAKEIGVIFAKTVAVSGGIFVGLSAAQLAISAGATGAEKASNWFEKKKADRAAKKAEKKAAKAAA